MVSINLFAAQGNRDADTDNRLGHGGGEGEGRINWESSTDITALCKIDSLWETSVWHRELSSAICDDVEGWDGAGGREVQER